MLAPRTTNSPLLDPSNAKKQPGDALPHSRNRASRNTRRYSTIDAHSTLGCFAIFVCYFRM